jgi:hypothetical protein
MTERWQRYGRLIAHLERFVCWPGVVAGETAGDTLAGTTGTWAGSPTYVYAWTRDGVDIAGPTTRVYILVTDDVGAMIGSRTWAAPRAPTPIPSVLLRRTRVASAKTTQKAKAPR